jgi:hypothetical protein
MGPAGSTLCSTATDLIRLAHLFLSDGRSMDGVDVLSPEAVRMMQQAEVSLPPVLVADWWGLGPCGTSWDGLEVIGHQGSNAGGASYVVWSPAIELAVAVTVNLVDANCDFAARVFSEVFGTIAGVRPPVTPKALDQTPSNPEGYAGEYEMSGATTRVSVAHDGGLVIARESYPEPWDTVPECRLLPVTEEHPVTFLPEDQRINYHYNWGLTFVGDDGNPPGHLLNGFFAMKRRGA